MTPEREAELRRAHAEMPSPMSTELFAEIDRLRAEVASLRDDPEFDATDGAHPAWWRGHDYVSARFKEELDKARRERDNLRADFESLEHDAAAVIRAWSPLADNEADFYSLCPTELRGAIRRLMDNGRDGWWEKK